MKLIRLVMLYFHTEDNDQLPKNWAVSINDVNVSSQKIGNAPEIKNKQRQLVFASIKLGKLPDKTDNNAIILQEEERRRTEHAIEAVANMFSIAERCQREISSASPCVAFQPENNDELNWLESSSGILVERDAMPDARFRLKLDDELVKSLSDRLDGVALLAEALAHKHATGKYHEFVRLYERAFLLPVAQLEKKLSQFLTGANLGYTRDEIKRWIQFRHPSIHADMKISQNLTLETDVTRYIPRMEQSAYDLLLNKNIWRDRGTERRNIWKPDIATTSSKYDLQLTQGKGAEFQFHVFDEFKAYPLDLNGILSPLPRGFWSKWNS
jgi:hypothetical protein